MLELQTYIPAFGAPTATPFGLKVMALLTLANAEYKTNYSADPRKAPKQKLPVLIDGTTTIADSDAIRDYLETKFKIDFDEGLSARDRAISRALIRMVEEHVYFAIICDRWVNDDNWEVVREKFFGQIPRLIRGFITKQIRKQAIASVKGQGMARHSTEEQLARVDKDLTAIKNILGDKPYLFGDKPTAADASVIGILTNIATTPVPTLLSKRLKDDTTLTAYRNRGCAALFPQA